MEEDKYWEPPKLKVYNSLGRKVDEFVPLDSQGTVKWYACGPTVYDDAHLGHARNYVSTDIIRRIMTHYFRYKVKFVMNITDIDDKIIRRGREQFVLSEYKRGRFDGSASLEGRTKDGDVASIAIADYLRTYLADVELKEEKLYLKADNGSERLIALHSYFARHWPKLSDQGRSIAMDNAVEQAYASFLGEYLSKDGASEKDKEAKTKDVTAKNQMHMQIVLGASRAVSASKERLTALPADADRLDDVLAPYIDRLYLRRRLGEIFDSNDHTIFTNLTREYERRYFEDMRNLNVMDPDVITRVTEYGPQIVDFVKRIEDKGFSYTIDGSVYFDVQAFEAAGNTYARLEPWNRANTDLIEDGEGHTSKPATKKKSPADFALWKLSKPGEPSWPSPWGPGRPGWHIECSAMASDKLGSQMDIHSGGIDLAFPHHDNELAQSEAYWIDKEHGHQHTWVNYFLHMGHLSIRGAKMSKSLKNFTTIKQALGRGDWTSRGLRIVFLLGAWKDGIEITESVVLAGAAWEEKVNNFFFKAREISESRAKYITCSEGDYLLERLKKAKKETHQHLLNSFDTPSVMQCISRLISEYNSADPSLVTRGGTFWIADWLTTMVNIFGLNGDTAPEDDKIGWSGIDVPESAKPIIRRLSEKRDYLRQKAIAKNISKEDLQPVKYLPQSLSESDQEVVARFKTILETFNKDLKKLETSQSLISDVLQLSDRLRNTYLWDEDVYLEDLPDRPARIRPVTRDLRLARQEKEIRETEKLRAKEAREREAAARAEKGKVGPEEMFRTEEYGAWDEKGVPTKDREGVELAKSRRNKLKKVWEGQRKLHEAWKAANGAT
ncbi:hypothetical protein MMC21_003722 [Puttea exsequens]|nr:hypothetical protein [Puttea exsequens]